MKGVLATRGVTLSKLGMKIKEPPDVDIYSELVLFYQDLEKELVLLNPKCTTCGTCCKFSTFDHILYTSSIEVDFIVRYVDIPDFDISKNICPFLKNNQCSIRDFRTLGCRVFYCDPHFKETSQSLYEKYYLMIKRLSQKYHTQWKYLPFLNQLNEFKSKLAFHAGKSNP